MFQQASLHSSGTVMNLHRLPRCLSSAPQKLTSSAPLPFQGHSVHHHQAPRNLGSHLIGAPEPHDKPIIAKTIRMLNSMAGPFSLLTQLKGWHSPDRCPMHWCSPSKWLEQLSDGEALRLKERLVCLYLPARLNLVLLSFRKLSKSRLFIEI
jgi:hypothetical protein